MQFHLTSIPDSETMSSQNAGPSMQGPAYVPTPTGNTPTTQAGTGTALSMQSRSTQIHYEIPILEDADGFTYWHFCMKLVLRDSDLLSVVDGTLPKPNVATDPDVYTSWVSRDLKAQLQIATMLHKGALNMIITGQLSQGLLGSTQCSIPGKRKPSCRISYAKLLPHAAD